MNQISPKQKLITTVWCAVTMMATLMLSHGHLIARELIQNWPIATTWEGRFESAIYTQGGLIFCASLIVTSALLARSYFIRAQEKEIARKELAQRERHERFTAARHEAMLDALASMFSSGESGGRATDVKPSAVTTNQKPIAKKG